MDNHMQVMRDKTIERTVKALRANNYDAHFIPDNAALLEKIAEYMPDGASCSVGGSVTLTETGVLDYLKSGRFDYHDRYAPDADMPKVFHQALCCDVYFTSTNAITEEGYLYNVDGNGNRVAAMIYGPSKVVVIAGYNKIVPNLEAARERVKTIAAPANNIRLSTPNPCTKTGHCMNCKLDTHTCVTETVFRKQRNKDRVAVLILPERYGY